MKYRLLCLVSIVLMLTVVFVVQKKEPERNRYHQHLEEPGYTACTNHGEEVFCTHMPLLSIDTDSSMPEPYLKSEAEEGESEKAQLVENNEMVTASVQVFDAETGNNHLTDTPTLKERANIRIRGKSSRSFDKKGYLLKFTKENGIDSKNVSLAGMTAESNWVLHGPILDKTLLRNYVCYNLAGTIMDYVPEVRFCELFLNGEYLGVYLIVEKIDYNSTGRCNITKTAPQMTSTSFILLLDTGSDEEEYNMETFFDYTGKRGLSNRRSEHFEIVYPSKTLTEAQKTYIIDEISQLEKSLASYDSSDKQRGYPAYLDVDSFVKYFVLNEFMMNADAGRLSTYFCKDIRGKITIIGWDYNNTFNNYFVDLTEYQEFYTTNKWYSYLLKDKRFVEQVETIYKELRKGILSEEYLSDYIDETVDYLGPAIERNYKKWGYTFTEEYCNAHSDIVLHPLERNPSNYQEAIEQLKDAISLRAGFMDRNIETLYSRCHESVNKQFSLKNRK